MYVDVVKALCVWALILPTTFALGSSFISFLPGMETILKGVLYSALGMAILSFGVVFLDGIHFLNSKGIWTFLFLCALFRVRAYAEWGRWCKTLALELLTPETRCDRILSVVFSLSFLALLLGTLTPEIGGDALCYHLNLPKRFLSQGSLVPLEYNENSLYPLFMNNLYLIGLATGGVFAAKLFHFYCGLLLFLALYRTLCLETANKTLALFMGLVLWSTPTLYNQLSTTYVDVALATFSFLALVTLLFALEQRRLAPFFVAGFLIGCALAVKYLALWSILSLGVVWTAVLFKNFDRKCGAAFLLWGTGIVTGSGYWLLRNLLLTGNPFYPFWGTFFVGAEQRGPADYFNVGMGKNLPAFLSVFWNMIFHPESFDGFPNRIGVFYFLFLPFIFAAALFVPRSRRYLLYLSSFLGIWFMMVQIYRWLPPVLPVMCLTAAMGLQKLRDFAPSSVKGLFEKATKLLGLGILSIYVMSGFYHYRYAYLLWIGRWSPPQYLNNFERTYPIASWINAQLPEKAKILVEAEPHDFYFDRDLIQDKVLKWRTRYDQAEWNLPKFRGFIKSLGVTHLLLSHPVLADHPSAQHPSRLQKLATSKFSRHLLSMKSENIRDARHVYDLYELL